MTYKKLSLFDLVTASLTLVGGLWLTYRAIGYFLILGGQFKGL